jgi:hypothetical protein
MEGGAVGHNFERDPPRDHPCQDWFYLVQRFLRRRFKCDPLSKYAKMSSNFNCSYMARSSLANIPDFSVKFFFQPIYTNYAN